MKRITYHSSLLITILALGLFSCEDVIEVDIDEAPALLVVDAWLDNKPGKAQTIRLTTAQPYFDAEFAPGVSGATVTVVKNEKEVYTFDEQESGNYVWMPSSNDSLGEPGDVFALLVEWNQENYGATTFLGPVPAIDSIGQEFRTDELGGPDGIYATLFARDLPGLGNAYWIKTFKNGQFLNKPQELNISFDAGFDQGAQLDGVNFIVPIREAVNRIPDSEGDDNSDVAPWAPGDSIRVEIHSISPEAFSFLGIARDQMTNGDNTIFAFPLANAKGNVINLSGGNEAAGVFNVAAISSLQRAIRPE